jgi:hypothetical protein
MPAKILLNPSQVEKLISAYVDERDNISNISRRFDITQKVVRRVLKENDIKFDGLKNRFYRVLTEETRKKIGTTLTGQPSPTKGIKHGIERKIKNIETNYKFKNYSLKEFTNYDKLKFISHWIAHKGYSKNGEKYIYDFIKKFYYDERFNKIYDNWINNKSKWSLPTLDHKISISQGEAEDLDNLQIMTWFENRAKAEMTDDEWNLFKRETKTTSNLFYE